MTDPGAERAQQGAGDFHDIVDVQAMDDSLVLSARIARRPGAGSAAVYAVAVLDGEHVFEETETVDPIEDWERAVGGPLQMTIEEPLERWTLTLEAPAARIELELLALTPPLDLGEPATSSIQRAAAIRRYSQLCEARGTARIGSRSRPVEALAVRSHRFGPVGEAARVRFVTAAVQTGTLLSLAAVRSAAAAGHGDELIGGQTIRAGGEPTAAAQPYETVRISTVFDDRGAPLKAGAELFRAGDEFPSRLAGFAVAPPGPDGAQTRATLFRFSLDGAPGVGSYEIETG